MKKTLIILAITVALGAAWSYGWHFVADKVEHVISESKARLKSQNREFQCANQAIGGFPFRISLICDETSYFDEPQGFFLEAGAMRSAAQAYQPGKAIVELDGPAVVTVAHNQTFDVKWDTMRANVAAGLGGIDSFSAIGKRLNLVPIYKPENAFSLDELQFHGRRVEANDVDLASVSHSVKSKGDFWPEFNLSTNIRFEDIYDQVSKKPDLLKIAKSQGLTGQVTDISYTSKEGGEVTLSGPMEVDSNGILSGKFDVSVTQLPQLVRSLAKALPEQQEMLKQIELGASLLSKVSTDGKIKLAISVNRGNAKLGIIPIGKIPPLY